MSPPSRVADPKPEAKDWSYLNTVMIGFDGPVLPDEVADMLAAGLGGVALFKRNLVEPGQVYDLCGSVRSAVGGSWPVPLIAVDQEGGRVQRLRGLVPESPPMSEVGRDGPWRARDVGREIGERVRSLGFNLDFAPVLDVDSNPGNPIIGDRAFSKDPGMVAECGEAFVDGLARTGVAACVKHFPGHGDTSLDSHRDLPVVEADVPTLNGRELVPFERVLASGVGMLMTAHCLYTALDDETPATLSRPIVNGLLRGRLGFRGVVVTDDLGMKAISDRFTNHEVLARGFDAGVDLFMHCGAGGEGAVLSATLGKMLVDGSLDAAVVEKAARRVLNLRESLS